MTRPTLDEYFQNLVTVIATRSTCLRRAVGCVLVDWKGHVLSTGYNGRPSGFAHCNESFEVYDYRGNLNGQLEYPNACDGAHASSGTNLEFCEAVHAEQNALLQCADVNLIETCYVSTSPCVTCTKLLLNTSCRRVVFREPYAHDLASRGLWYRGGRRLGSWVDLSY